MNNTDAQNMLNDILKFLKYEDYTGAKKYIEQKKNELISKNDVVSDYMNNLVRDLK